MLRGLLDSRDRRTQQAGLSHPRFEMFSGVVRKERPMFSDDRSRGVEIDMTGTDTATYSYNANGEWMKM